MGLPQETTDVLRCLPQRVAFGWHAGWRMRGAECRVRVAGARGCEGARVRGCEGARHESDGSGVGREKQRHASLRAGASERASPKTERAQYPILRKHPSQRPGGSSGAWWCAVGDVVARWGRWLRECACTGGTSSAERLSRKQRRSMRALETTVPAEGLSESGRKQRRDESQQCSHERKTSSSRHSWRGSRRHKRGRRGRVPGAYDAPSPQAWPGTGR